MQCNPRYPDTSIHRCVSTGWRGERRGTWPLNRPWPSGSYFFNVKLNVLDKVESFCYLGQILAQDDEDVRAVRSQIKKAHGTWARVGQVLQVDNTPPKVSAMFYKAVVQSVLLYSSETWNLTKTALAQLEGFHIRAAYLMAKKHKPRRRPNQVWVYPATSNVLVKECGMNSIAHYIGVRRETIFQYVVDRPIYALCTECEQRRGLAPQQWWWEQKMCLNNKDAEGAGKLRHLGQVD